MEKLLARGVCAGRTEQSAAGLTAEECSRIMNHAWGSKIEAKHYDKSEFASAKVSGMAKWEAWLGKVI